MPWSPQEVTDVSVETDEPFAKPRGSKGTTFSTLREEGLVP
jgi:hypothetical protein